MVKWNVPRGYNDMELETNQFIKNKENDVFDHRTRGEWLIVQSVRYHL